MADLMDASTSTEAVGRERELRDFARLLDAREPGLALIAAGPGMGKSTLVGLLRNVAIDEGWRAAYGDALRIGPETTVDGFREAVLEGLGLPSHGGLAAEGGDFRVEPRTPRSWTGLTPGSDTDGARQDPLVALLARRVGRFAILIDGFRPSRRMVRWFTGTFVPAVQRGDTPVVVVVADTTTALGPLHRLANHVEEIGPPDEGSIREYLKDAGARPALSRDELAAYVEAAANRPELVHVFGRLLALTAMDDPFGLAPAADDGGPSDA